MSERYGLQNRYQDSGWEDLDQTYESLTEAVFVAAGYSLKSIIYGMTRVVDHWEGSVVITFPAGEMTIHSKSNRFKWTQN